MLCTQLRSICTCIFRRPHTHRILGNIASQKPNLPAVSHSASKIVSRNLYSPNPRGQTRPSRGTASAMRRFDIFAIPGDCWPSVFRRFASSSVSQLRMHLVDCPPTRSDNLCTSEGMSYATIAPAGNAKPLFGFEIFEFAVSSGSGVMVRC